MCESDAFADQVDDVSEEGDEREEGGADVWVDRVCVDDAEDYADCGEEDDVDAALDRGLDVQAGFL